MASGLTPKTPASLGPTERDHFEALLRNMGVLHTLNDLKQGDCGEELINAGFNLTAVGCVAVRVGSTDFIFAKGPAFYFGWQGYGPEGVFLLQRDNETGHYTPRTYYSPIGHVAIDNTCVGLEALRHSYPNAGWPT